MGAMVASSPNKPRQDKSIAGVASFTPLYVSDKIEGGSSWVNSRQGRAGHRFGPQYRPGETVLPAHPKWPLRTLLLSGQRGSAHDLSNQIVSSLTTSKMPK